MKTSVLATASRLILIEFAVGLPRMTVPGNGLLLITAGFEAGAGALAGEEIGTEGEVVEGEEDAGRFCGWLFGTWAGWVAFSGGTTLQPAMRAIQAVRNMMHARVFISISGLGCGYC
jgi:hypothetical protein